MLRSSGCIRYSRGADLTPKAESLPAERASVNGTAQGWAAPLTVITPNDSLEIAGTSIAPVVSNAGRCVLHTPQPTQPAAAASPPGFEPAAPEQLVIAQPCEVTNRPAPAQVSLPAPEAVAVSVANAAAAEAALPFYATGLRFEPSCGFAMQPNVSAECEAAQPRSQASFDEQSGLVEARGAAQRLPGPTAGDPAAAVGGGGGGGAAS